MLATVSQTRSLKGSYYYDRALNQKEKGGRVVAANGIPQYSPAATQLAYMQAYSSDKYEVKAINIVLSHSKYDKDVLTDNKEKQNKYVNDFLSQCKKLGIDLDNVPWIMFEHVNTDCLHYHLIVLTTRFDGKRLDTGFMGKRAARAAYIASKDNGLHYAEGWERREKAYQEIVAKNFGEKVSQDSGLTESQKAKLKKVSKENRATKSRAETARRKQSAEEASARREKIKNLVHSAANSCINNGYNMERFIISLELDGIKYGEDDKGNYTVTANNGKRDVTYKMARLGIDTTLIDSIKENERKSKAEEERKAQEKIKAENERKAQEKKLQEEAAAKQKQKEAEQKKQEERPKFKWHR